MSVDVDAVRTRLVPVSTPVGVRIGDRSSQASPAPPFQYFGSVNMARAV
jgi:hypothetical protein